MLRRSPKTLDAAAFKGLTGAGRENALQVFPSIMGVIPEARLNLCIYYLNQNQLEQAQVVAVLPACRRPAVLSCPVSLPALSPPQGMACPSAACCTATSRRPGSHLTPADNG